jgi:hypothetical protein
MITWPDGRPTVGEFGDIKKINLGKVASAEISLMER